MHKAQEQRRADDQRFREQTFGGALWQRARGAARAVTAWSERRRNIGVLAELDDATLQDIGLDREALRTGADREDLFAALRSGLADPDGAEGLTIRKPIGMRCEISMADSLESRFSVVVSEHAERSGRSAWKARRLCGCRDRSRSRMAVDCGRK